MFNVFTGGCSQFGTNFTQLSSMSMPCVDAKMMSIKSLVSPTCDWSNGTMDDNNMTHENNIILKLPASAILPFLYLGNERDADYTRLKELDISYVLNVTSHIPSSTQQEGITYKRLPAADNCHQNLKQYFEEAFEFIGKFSVYSNLCAIIISMQWLNFC